MTTDKRTLRSTVPWISVVCAAWPGLLLAALCLLPYLNKAYTIDDPYFLTQAQQILKAPLRPMNFELCWVMGDEVCAKAADYASGAALMGYALVPVILSGGAEWIAHTMQLAFGWLAIVAMVALALRMGWGQRYAMFAGLLLVAIPPFLPMASTAMPDTLALCLGLAGIERLAAWKAEGRWSQGIAAGLALGLAPFARPHLALLLSLSVILLLDSVRIPDLWNQFRESPRRWAPVVIAALVLFSVSLATRERSLVLNPPSVVSGLQFVKRNLFAYFLYMAIPIPLAIPWIAMHWKRAPLLFWIAPAGVAIGLRLIKGTANDVGWWAIMAAGFGVAAISHILYTEWKRGDAVRVFLALWLLIPLAPIVYMHLPIKYLLAASPAVILILLGLSETISPRLALASGFVLVLAGAVYSCMILHADARFADLGRKAAAELIAPRAAAGEKVWFGGQWGFHWYAERAGALVSKPGIPGPLPGDLLAVGLNEGGRKTRDRFPQRTLVRSVVTSCECGRTMSRGAGLYSNHFGNVLWTWDKGELGRYELWRIQ